MTMIKLQSLAKISFCGFLLVAASGATANTGTLAALSFAGAPDDMRAMSDTELGETRGGYGGILFSLSGYGDISSLSGDLPPGVNINSQSSDLVSLDVGLASLPNTGGFVQFASIVGNNNIVNNNLTLNVYILEGGIADTSGITNGSAFGF
ncbi:hypothetical protein AB1K62_05155 [Parasphingorhabdus sp. JC815]|uniref:hypothetical protein n=1 Tax=Parasphingorhabdus sp. JC815 TaxID=3232140 RepID=UPI003457B18E